MASESGTFKCIYRLFIICRLFIHSFVFISGDLGKELKNLISLMDEEEAAEVANTRTAKNKLDMNK